MYVEVYMYTAFIKFHLKYFLYLRLLRKFIMEQGKYILYIFLGLTDKT